MDGKRENCASRRALVTGGPALAVIAAVAAETGIALASAADPYVALGAEYFRLRDAVDNATSDDESDAAFNRWAKHETRMGAVRPSSLAGAAVGLRVALSELYQFHFGDEPFPGQIFLIRLVEGAIATLDREAARG